MKRSHIPSRLNKIEEMMGTDENNLLITIVPSELSTEEATAFVYEKNPNFKGLHVIVNVYGDLKAEEQLEYDDIDLKIEAEKEKIKKYGPSEIRIP